MKNKGYFCDWCDKYIEWRVPLIIISLVVCIGVACFIANEDFENKWEEGYYIYDEEGYKYLEEIIDKCLIPHENIDLKTLRELTNNSCQITEGEENFKIIYSLPNQYSKLGNDKIQLSVTMSDNFLVLSKERDYPSEETYIRVLKFESYEYYIIRSLLVWWCIMVVGCISLTISIIISMKRKAKREKK